MLLQKGDLSFQGKEERTITEFDKIVNNVPIGY